MTDEPRSHGHRKLLLQSSSASRAFVQHVMLEYDLINAEKLWSNGDDLVVFRDGQTTVYLGAVPLLAAAAVREAEEITYAA